MAQQAEFHQAESDTDPLKRDVFSVCVQVPHQTGPVPYQTGPRVMVADESLGAHCVYFAVFCT